MFLCGHVHVMKYVYMLHEQCLSVCVCVWECICSMFICLYMCRVCVCMCTVGVCMCACAVCTTHLHIEIMHTNVNRYNFQLYDKSHELKGGGGGAREEEGGNKRGRSILMTS